MDRILKVSTLLLILGITMSLPVWAQESVGPSASESMHQAGKEAEGAAQNLYEGTKTAFQDTKITAKVKTALSHNDETKKSDIDVHTTAGIVTLTGKVPSLQVANRAELLAKNTEGVRDVDNKILIMRAEP